MNVRWTRRAASDLDEIVLHIAGESPAAALRMEDRIVGAAATLGEFPLRGRLGWKEGVRELVVAGTPYIIAYEAAADIVWIDSVRHGAQDWPPAESV